ncbi:TPA: glycosyltransferase family 61 protein [Aeromonas veronii]
MMVSNEYTQIFDSLTRPWLDARDIGDVSSPAIDYCSPTFHSIRGATSTNDNNEAFNILESQLFCRNVHSKSIILNDSYVFGCGFLIHSTGSFVRQSRYLNHDAEARIKNSLRNGIKVLDDSKYWIVGSNASFKNYWHWHAQSLPCILHCIDFLLSKGIYNYGVIVPEPISWQTSSLEAIGIAKDNIVPITVFDSVYAKKVVCSELMYAQAPFFPSIYRHKVRDLMLEHFTSSFSTELPAKIYISRADSSKRKLLNEDAISKELSKLGFKTLILSELTHAQQVQVFNSAKYIVCPHGAGTTNVLFCNNEASVLELHQKSYPNAGPASLLKTNGARYYADIYDDDGLGQKTKGWSADTRLCLDTVQRMMSN